MLTASIRKFAEEINKEYGLNLNFVVKSNFLDISYVLKNGEEVLKEHNEISMIFAYMQGMKFALKQCKEENSNV